MSRRTLRTALPFVAAALASAAAAGDSLAPCHQVLPQPTDYLDAFEAEGWTVAKEERGRAQALAQLLPGAYFFDTLPRPPESPEDHARLLERAAESDRIWRFEKALFLTRGEAAVAVVFDAEAASMGRRLECWIAAPHLAELDALPLAPPELEGGIDTAMLTAVAELPPPPGATEFEVWSTRLQSDFATGDPIPGADVQVVSLLREEPRIVLPEFHGLLRAFGPDELADAIPPEGE